MANPLYPGNNYPQYSQYQQPRNNPVSNFSDFLNNFNNFKMGFQGDPEAQVKELLRSGRMTPVMDEAGSEYERNEIGRWIGRLEME